MEHPNGSRAGFPARSMMLPFCAQAKAGITARAKPTVTAVTEFFREQLSRPESDRQLHRL
jgi:hypothetical protein